MHSFMYVTYKWNLITCVDQNVTYMDEGNFVQSVRR
jgi:hypothetical protein